MTEHYQSREDGQRLAAKEAACRRLSKETETGSRQQYSQRGKDCTYTHVYCCLE